jgi:hypothetical protein
MLPFMPCQQVFDATPRRHYAPCFRAFALRLTSHVRYAAPPDEETFLL